MEYLSNLTDAQAIVSTLGLIGILSVIFAESGLFFGFFLPGDSLLFTAGLFASQGHLSLTGLLIGGTIAAIVGDSVGYAFGKKAGPRLFSREDSLLFHKKHAIRAKNFYDKYGTKTIVIARFVPVVRTFAPIVAGIGNMPYKTFLTYNIIGGVTWIFSVSLAGYFLGTLFPGIKDHLEAIILGIIFLSILPVIIEFIREKRKSKATIVPLE
ncbi:MAG TPA: VTT domain-containing protein [Candidatus Paceibacterota bacterium]